LARPFRGPNGFDVGFTIDGRSHEEQAEQPFLNYEAVTPGYFEAAGIPLLAGRGFADSDDGEARPVAIVSRVVADRFWPDGNALGSRVKWGGPDSEAPWITVVGIVGNARYRGVEKVSLDAYVPSRQSPWPPRTLALRGELEPATLMPAIRGELRRLEPAARAVDAATTDELVASSLQGPRFNTTLLGLFGTLALAIGAVGLYGVLSYNLARRTRELGLRIALGATRRSVMKLALGRGLGLTAVGIALGVAVGAAATRLVAGQLFGVSPLDPSTFAATPMLLLGVGAAASLLPALRASRVDPLAALREE
jgi:putative ABC transport system permease protein